MSDEQKDGPEVAYPGHGPHSDGPGPVEDHSDPIEKQVSPGYVITPGTESTEERREMAAERRAELGFDAPAGKANGVDERDPDDVDEHEGEQVPGTTEPTGEDGEKDEDDDEPELSDESDDEEPKLPADDSPIHGESTIEQGSTDPTL